MAEIDSLEIKISASADSAADGVNKLIGTLTDLQRALAGGLGINAVLNDLREIKESCESMKGADTAAKNLKGALESLGKVKIESIEKVKQLGNVLNELSSTAPIDMALPLSILDLNEALRDLATVDVPAELLSDLKKFMQIAASVPTNTKFAEAMNQLATGIKKLNGASIPPGLAAEIKSFVAGLKGLDGKSLDSGFTKSMKNLGSAIKSLNEVTIPDTLAAELQSFIGQLSTLGGDSLNSTLVTNLRTLGNTLKTLSAVSISPSLVGQLQSFAAGINALNVSQNVIDSLNRLANVLRRLQNTSIGGQLGQDLANLANSLWGLDFSGVEQLVNALTPLGMLNGLHIREQLEGLPAALQAVADVDLTQFIQNVNQLVEALTPLAPMMQQVANGAAAFGNGTARMASQAATMSASMTRTGRSATDLYSMIKMSVGAVKGLANTMAQFITESNQYIENLNLFTASMGEYASEAQAYAEKVGEVMGIDPSDWMRAQGVFQTLATGFGVASDRATIMSTNLTQLGYDLSSFFNISVADAMQKLQSGISGELEPLRRLGYDLSKAKLEAIALEMGITKSFNQMSQAEKAQLRYEAIMNQVTTAQGDMARTLDSPSNQLRILSAQATQAARALGNVFIPVLNRILPVAIAVVKAIRMVANAIASLFGFSLPSVDYSSLESTASSASDLDENLTSAGGSAKKLQQILMGFDEINNITDSDSSGGGGGGGSVGDGFDFDLSKYDFLGNAITTKIEEMYAKIEPIVNWIIEHMGEILSVVEGIGAALLLWKLAKTFVPDLSLAQGALGNIASLIGAIAVTALTVTLTYTFTNDYLVTGDPFKLIDSVLTTALGSFLAGKLAFKALGGSAGYWAGAITLGLSIIANIISLATNIADKGITKESIITGVVTALEGAAAGILVAKAVGASLAAGAVIGFVLTASVLLVVGVLAWAVNASKVKPSWGDVDITQEQAQEMVNSLFQFDVEATVNILTTAVKDWEIKKNELNEKITTFSSEINKVVITGKIDENTYSNLVSDINTIVSNVQSALDEGSNLITLTATLVPMLNSSGDDVSGQVLSAQSNSSAALSIATKQIGENLAAALAEGLKTGMQGKTPELIKYYTDWMNDITSAYTTGKAKGELEVGIASLNLSDLTESSFKSTWAMYESQMNAYKQSAVDATNQARIEMEGELAMWEIQKQKLLGENRNEEAAQAQAYIDELNAAINAWDPEASVASAMDAAKEVAREKWQKALQDIFGSSSDTSIFNNNMNRAFVGVKLAFDNNAVISPESIQSAADGFVDQLHDYIQRAAKDNPELLQAQEMFGFTDWDLLTEATKVDFFNSIVASTNFDTAIAILGAMDVFQLSGWDAMTADAKGELYNSMVAVVGEKGAVKLMEQYGIDVAQFFANGMIANSGAATSAGETLGQNAGSSVVQGAADTITNGQAEVNTATDTMLSGAEQKVETATGNMTTNVSAATDTVEKEVKTATSNAETTMNTTAATISEAATTLGTGVETTMNTAVGHVEASWNAFPTWFKTNVTDTIISGLTSAPWYKTGHDAAKNLKDGFNSVTMPNFHITWSTTSSTVNGTTVKVPMPKLTFYKAGGFPTMGELFVAGEAGPEMVGQIGNKNAVANSGQIIDGIASGVAEANGEQNSLLREQNTLLRQLLSKESSVRISPSAALGRVSAQSIDLYARMAGGSV